MGFFRISLMYRCVQSVIAVRDMFPLLPVARRIIAAAHASASGVPVEKFRIEITEAWMMI